MDKYVIHIQIKIQNISSTLENYLMAFVHSIASTQR